MSTPVGPADFFALEAGEFLERLDALVSKDAAPAGEEFVRMARAVRGSALMAKFQSIARAATGLEMLARALRDGTRGWTPETKQLAIRAVDDLKIFVRRAGSWTAADDEKADALGQSLEVAAGRRSAALRTVPETLDAGTRAFVAREGAAIASVLDRAAQALTTNPLAHDPLQQIAKAAQPLRGLAALNDLPPMPDLLEGVERVTALAQQPGFQPPAQFAELFRWAAAAMTKAAREVAERGRPDADAAEFRHFARTLTTLVAGDGDVVPVESLFYDDAGPHVVKRGTAPTRAAVLGRLELVSHGEHLRQAADSLERAPSQAQREIRAHALGGALRALEVAAGGPLAENVGRFARAAREAISKGLAVSDAKTFSGLLRKIGDILAKSGSGDETVLAQEFDPVIMGFQTLAGSAPAPAAAAAPAAPGSRPAALPADDERPAESPDLMGSWVLYERLVRERGMGTASLADFMVGVSLDTTRPAAGAGDTGPRPVVARPSAPQPTPRTAEPATVDVRTLLYKGESARRRIAELRERAKGLHGEDLRAILDEVCDLVDLAADRSPSS
jgi:hypothetical protein